MAANIASRCTPEDPTKDRPASSGRDVRKDTQEDRRTATTNNLPPHGHVSHGFGAFLSWLHPETPIEQDVLAAKYDHWANTDSPRDDPAPTWDALEGWSK